MPAKKTTEEFIEKARSVWGNLYDYSRAEYKGVDENIDIICAKHGVFSIRANNFLKGHGCPVCSNRQRINTEAFIKRATKIHGSRYDYSLVDCKGSNSMVKIICPIHGIFTQKAIYHLHGNGCQKCFGTPKSNTIDFINKAEKLYPGKYDYSKVIYNGNKEKISIICPIHGEWQVTPNNFLRGSECPKCYGTPKHTTEEFIEISKKIHGDKYDYSKAVYSGGKAKVCIICPTHGEFWQRAGSHMRGSGCFSCTGKNRIILKDRNYRKINKELFISESRKNHSIHYDYSKVNFNISHDKVCIICPTHGEFWQDVGYHMRGGNCPICAGSYKLTAKTFIERSKEIHGDKYDYSQVDYRNYSTKVHIICPKHGDFWQTPNNHLYGCGCPACPQSNMEGELREFLIRNNIDFEQEKTFDWLKHKRHLFLDFYLPKYNVAIECQGKQHYSPVELFGGEKFYNETRNRDTVKNKLCKMHGIRMLYFTKSNNVNSNDTTSSYKKLLAMILDDRSLNM